MLQTDQLRYETLYKKHINALIRQGKAATTIDAYSRAVRRITYFFDESPDTLTQDHFEKYFQSLIQTHSLSTVKTDRNGLQFFYKYVLQKEWKWVDIVKPPVVKTLPDVLTIDEIRRLLDSAKDLRYQTFILVCFSMGLRLSETLNLKIGDIDSERMKVHIREAKGKKDRYVTLPQSALQALRKYWKTHRNPNYLFPSGNTTVQRQAATIHMGRGRLQQKFKSIVRHTGIRKKISIHSLRHSYGTVLTEANISLRKIQQEMGHVSPNTTARYTQLSDVFEINTENKINMLMNRVAWQQPEKNKTSENNDYSDLPHTEIDTQRTIINHNSGPTDENNNPQRRKTDRPTVCSQCASEIKAWNDTP